MMNTAETAKRHYETENRENHTERKKFSNAMAMILGILVTVEIMILGAMVMKIDVHSADCDGTGFCGSIFRCSGSTDR